MTFRALIILLLSSVTAHAFDRDASLSVYQTYTENPDPDKNDIYIFDNQTLQGIEWRENWKARPFRRVKFGSQLIVKINGASDDEILSQAITSATPNRSPKLRNVFKEEETIHGEATFEKLLLKGYKRSFSWTIGRFPIDMSKTYLFRPNDFFGPYSITQFDRSYKPGVDSLQMRYALGGTSQLRATGVVGYCTTEGEEPPPTKGDTVCESQSSGLLEFGFSLLDHQWDAFAGKVRKYNVIGLSGQGELSKRFATHFEFHEAFHTEVEDFFYYDLVFGLDIRLTKSFLLQPEYYFHGQGYATVEEYSERDEPTAPDNYLGNQYGGFNLTYRYSSLTTFSLQSQYNMVDNSSLSSIMMRHNYAQNADLLVSIAIPGGEEPIADEIQSEFGTLPKFANITTSIYF